MKIKRMRPQSVIPTRATTGSAGYDLSADIDAPVEICYGRVTKIPTGVAIELPKDHVGLVFGRSGHGTKYGVTMANNVGVIDSDYRGEIFVSLVCSKSEGYTVQPQERIAQLVIMPISTPELLVCEELSDTARGDGGFGSTGKATS